MAAVWDGCSVFHLPVAAHRPTIAGRVVISAGIEVARVHLPGRETRLREPLFNRLASLVDTLVEELIPWIDGPFALFGHSMGALLVFELARGLRRRHGLLPVHLFVSGYRAPQLPPSESPFSHLPDAEFIDRVRRYGGLPDLVAQNEELIGDISSNTQG